ncbi:MAG: hypothetical protein O3A00_19665, partial [Planctomycetota bacterium]|nr:hypothetical protein [Planctomycetota bacterium]
ISTSTGNWSSIRGAINPERSRSRQTLASRLARKPKSGDFGYRTGDFGYGLAALASRLACKPKPGDFGYTELRRQLIGRSLSTHRPPSYSPTAVADHLLKDKR